MTKTEFVFALIELSNHKIGKKEAPILFLCFGGGKLNSIQKIIGRPMKNVRASANLLCQKGYLRHLNKGSLDIPLYLPTTKGSELIMSIMIASDRMKAQDNPNHN